MNNFLPEAHLVGRFRTPSHKLRTIGCLHHWCNMIRQAIRVIARWKAEPAIDRIEQGMMIATTLEVQKLYPPIDDPRVIRTGITVGVSLKRTWIGEHTYQVVVFDIKARCWCDADRAKPSPKCVVSCAQIAPRLSIKLHDTWAERVPDTAVVILPADGYLRAGIQAPQRTSRVFLRHVSGYCP